MNTIFFQQALLEFKKSAAYKNDDLIEYNGSQYLENELIMSSPDKLMFLVKDMVAHLSRTYKKNLNPYFASKLDLYSIHNFTFPE